jgi:hypothetical protein
MVYSGKFKDGVVILDDATGLADGTAVSVAPVEPIAPSPEKIDPATLPTWNEVFKDVIGAVKGLPSDFAKNHDHYIHGTPK